MRHLHSWTMVLGRTSSHRKSKIYLNMCNSLIGHELIKYHGRVKAKELAEGARETLTYFKEQLWHLMITNKRICYQENRLVSVQRTAKVM